MKNNFEVQKNKVQLYCNQVFITDEVKNILPDFLTLLHGVIDSPDIPLNVSRSYLQEDANVKKISAHITKKVADKMMSMFNQDRADFEQKWKDIGVFIHYGVLTDEKFAEKASGFTLYKNSDDTLYTLEELKNKVKDLQTDKNGDCVILYADSAVDQFSAISSAKERGYEVIVMEGPLSPHFISHIEQKNEKLKFKRVDSDIIEKLIEKEDLLPSALSEEQQKDIKVAIEKLIDAKTYHVEFASLSPSDAPFVITQNEFMRRMKEQSAMGGGGFYGTLPDSYNLVANSNHPLFSQTLKSDDGGIILPESKVKQAIDLALLSKGLLKGEPLDQFVKRSFVMLADS
jgi:molecular chaperone HtpG